MAIVSCSAFIDALRQFQLLQGEQLSDVSALASGSNADVGGISKALIQRGWLTSFQVNLLLAGQGPKLLYGPYILHERLNKAGPSEVYKAHHPEHGWTVALKIVARPERLAVPAAADQFFHEMQAIAELEHPNIVQLLDAGKVDGGCYCAMEFVEGTDLAKVVRRKGPLSSELAATYARQTALALQCAHEHNLVHRAINPTNLFLANSSFDTAAIIKILDWGQVALRPTGTQVEAKDKQADDSQVVGTSEYLAPEQVAKRESADCRSDIYSLGCTLYFLLTAVPPVGATKPPENMSSQETAPPIADGQMEQRKVPPRLAAIVRRMTAAQPKERFQTPAAVAMALSSLYRVEKSATGQIQHHSVKQTGNTTIPSTRSAAKM